MRLKYEFEEKFIEGLIKSRPNRFLMEVKIKDKVITCHCPSTGRIGNIIFEDIPCLLSKSTNEKRKTPYTVEAISLDKNKNKKWIGINQTKMNNYVNFFLKQGKFSKMIKNEIIQRERKLGNSRIDFLVGESYLEVKMPLIRLPNSNLPKKITPSKFNSFDRLIKHFGDISNGLNKNNKAIVLLAYVYPAEPFTPPKTDSSNIRIVDVVNSASKKGVETWQANFKIDKEGITLIKYFKLNLF